MSGKKNGFRLLYFAKKTRNLSPPEKAALVVISDAAGDIGGVCTRVISTMADDWGHCHRKIRRGINGYTDKGKVKSVGLKNRGLIYSEGSTKGGIKSFGDDGSRRGFGTHWRVNAYGLLAYLPEKYAAKLAECLEVIPQIPTDDSEETLSKYDTKGDTKGDTKVDTVPGVRVTQGASKYDTRGGVSMTRGPSKYDVMPTTSLPAPPDHQPPNPPPPNHRLSEVEADSNKNHGQGKDLKDEFQKILAAREISTGVPQSFVRLVEALAGKHSFDLAVKGAKKWLRERDVTGLRNVAVIWEQDNLAADVEAQIFILKSREQQSEAVKDAIEAGRVEFQCRDAELLAKRAEEQEAIERLRESPF